MGVVTAPRVTYRCHDCGASHTIEHIRRNLYYGQRTLGDLQAASRGRLGRRLVRRTITRSLMRSLFR
jgi:hypothetical protein